MLRLWAEVSVQAVERVALRGSHAPGFAYGADNGFLEFGSRLTPGIPSKPGVGLSLRQTVLFQRRDGP